MKTKTEQRKAIAIATSDWHFWQTAPVWRSCEENWLKAMGRPLVQLINLSYSLNVPILNAGDVFDHYNPSPECVNFLLDKLVNKMIAIPGQHDLENHVLENLYKTGFETLRSAGVIECLESYWCPNSALTVYPAPWGTDFGKMTIGKDFTGKKILLAHKYIWMNDETRYGGQEIPAGKLTGFKQFLQNFDFAIFGDNHIPFRTKVGNCQVVNCGTMVRRKLDEKDYETGCTVLYNDGSIEFIPFDVSLDKYLRVQVEEQETEQIDVSSRKFMEELRSMEDGQIDYRTEVERKVQETGRKDMEEQFETIFNEYEENGK